jgi:predicted O-methyltransferase YrrM
VLAIFGRLQHDQYMNFVENYYRRGLESFGESWVYADINTVLLGLARLLRVESYLEIGVRRGRSMAMIAAQQSGCYIAGFDMWMENYGGMENPGPDFVRAEMQHLGHHGQLELISGDSHRTVPQYFKDNPARFFDLITVDGDHSEMGAAADLVTVMPRIKIGGALVFDDVSHQSFPYLRQVWTGTVASNPRFSPYMFEETGFGIAFAIRKY